MDILFVLAPGKIKLKSSSPWHDIQLAVGVGRFLTNPSPIRQLTKVHWVNRWMDDRVGQNTGQSVKEDRLFVGDGGGVGWLSIWCHEMHESDPITRGLTKRLSRFLWPLMHVPQPAIVQLSGVNDGAGGCLLNLQEWPNQSTDND